MSCKFRFYEWFQDDYSTVVTVRCIVCRYATVLIYKFILDSRLITCVLPCILSLSYCEFRRVLVILCVCTVRFTLSHADFLRVHGWNKFVLVSYVALMCFLIPYAYGIKSFHYLLVLVSYFSAIRRGMVYVFHSLSLTSKFSRWLSERVSNALVGLLTLRLPSPG